MTRPRPAVCAALYVEPSSNGSQLTGLIFCRHIPSSDDDSSDDDSASLGTAIQSATAELRRSQLSSLENLKFSSMWWEREELDQFYQDLAAMNMPKLRSLKFNNCRGPSENGFASLLKLTHNCPLLEEFQFDGYYHYDDCCGNPDDGVRPEF